MIHAHSISTSIREKLTPYADFPQPGILFQDVTPIFRHADLMASILELLTQRYAHSPIDAVLGLEARGFILAPMIALALKTKFIPVRKKGKLPGKTHQCSFVKEYGDPLKPDTFEISIDSLQPGEKVILFDDLIATGETLRASERLVELAQGITLESICLIELLSLKGREKLKSPLFSLVQL